MVLNQLGLSFEIAPDIGRIEGITRAQSILDRCVIDETKCSRLIKALENYRAQYNEKTEAHSREPMHTWASHGSDAFRYLSVSLDLIENPDYSAADLEQRYQRKMNGGVANSSVFGKM
jgi:hypothetical protein